MIGCPCFSLNVPTTKEWSAGGGVQWCKSSEVIEKADTFLWQEIGKNLVMLTSFSDVSQILEL